MNKITRATQLLMGKAQHENYDTLELQEKRRKFLEKCVCWKVDGQIQVSTMYDNGEEVVSSKDSVFNYFNKYHNTLKMIPSMIVIELESKDKNFLWRGVVATYYNLAKENLHFALFHTSGSKSYYFLMFDFLKLNELNPLQRAKARELFTQAMVNMEHYHLVDKAFFYERKMPLMFSPHWRHKLPFDLLVEFTPKTQELKCKSKT